ncbi:hypothetical protein KVR01_007924 [Diaporthe batatas]|uniref:uncharacterized protein n=1 Tax=Diaporthe batatas TaxID=748121 RepID=UPI001D056219|nr:uncharacterized protein KVR01_007924 [Diaporthe batatas]KAG8162159.1 hypothetical protein KVR01_007924 [Diaporthe batatas]
MATAFIGNRADKPSDLRRPPPRTSPPSSLSPPPNRLSPGSSIRGSRSPVRSRKALGPEDVAAAIEAGIRRVITEDTATVIKLPLHDGGEGFCKALVAAQGGDIIESTVTGPIGEPVESHFGLTGETKDVAVLDMAAAAGLRLVPKTHRDPTRTTTYGVGELMKAALDKGVSRIIIGCGDSGTSDGGAGMLQALGAKLLDEHGNELPAASGGAALSKLARISLEKLHPRLLPGAPDRVKIEAVCNIKNILCGPNGVARVYGPQKGATSAQVEILSDALDNLAAALEPILATNISYLPGSGASGGLGAGLMLLGAELRARSEAINAYFHIDDILEQRWDFVFTAEGSLDSQSAKGKMTVEVARRARDYGAQVIALAGTIGDGADTVYEEGIEAFTSILNGPLSLEQAIEETEKLLKDSAERTVRMIQTGMSIRQSDGDWDTVDEGRRRSSPKGLGIMRAFTS